MEMALKIVSGAAWAYAYWRIIAVSRLDKSYGMPLFAASLNLTWESIYFTGGVAYWGRYDLGTQVQTIINGIWLVLDVGIMTCIVRYGQREFGGVSRLWFRCMAGGAIALALALQIGVLTEFDPEKAARLSAFLQNVCMSAAFVAMLIARNSSRGQRGDIAVARLIGTLAPTISAGFIGGLVPTLVVFGLCCFALDSTYLLILRTFRIRTGIQTARAQTQLSNIRTTGTYSEVL
jgi:hypothetical protein